MAGVYNGSTRFRSHHSFIVLGASGSAVGNQGADSALGFFFFDELPRRLTVEGFFDFPKESACLVERTKRWVPFDIRVSTDGSSELASRSAFQKSADAVIGRDRVGASSSSCLPNGQSDQPAQAEEGAATEIATNAQASHREGRMGPILCSGEMKNR